MARIMLTGTTFSAALFLPPLTGAAIYSESILTYWLGPDYAVMAPWLSIPFLWTAVLTFSGVGASMLVARRTGLRRLNLIALLQILLFLAVGWGGISLKSRRAARELAHGFR